MIRASIFDLDGTLVHSLPGIAASLNRALAQHGFASHAESAVRNFIGNGSWMLCRRGVPAEEPDSQADAVNAAFMEDYARTWPEGTELFPGIAELLIALGEAGLPLAVFSNKPHPFTLDIVDRLFAPGTFAPVLGHREGSPRKPDPAGALEIAKTLALDPAHLAFVGDSTVDFETGRNAGMHPLLVSWGYRPAEELTATAAPVLRSADQLRKYLLEPGPGA